jgi:hypothetical protein
MVAPARSAEEDSSQQQAGAAFDVYGFRFRVTEDGAPAAAGGLADDFAFFRRDHVDRPLEILLRREDPPYDDVPTRPASVYTPRNVSLSNGPRTFIDYSGRALAVYDRALQTFRVHSRHSDLLYEAAYLFLLSRIGESLDAAHLHRIHAMALSYRSRAVLAILPMGGGKSTLAAEMLKVPDFGFLSDDSPFIDPEGAILAFPLRLGLLPGGEGDVPEEYRRTINRMEFGPKILVRHDVFRDRITSRAEPGIVFLGYRSLSPDCRIEPARTGESYRSMITNCAVGLGLFQGLEFVLRSSPWELAGKARVGWSRLSNARRLFHRSEVYRLVLGRNPAENARVVTDFVRARLTS